MGPTTSDLGDGANVFALSAASTVAAVTLKAKGGIDQIDLVSSQVTGNATFTLAAGNNRVGLDNATLAANLIVKTGGGDDTVTFLNGAVVQGTQTLDLGGGTNTVTP